MSETVEYRVKRGFKYGDRRYKPGELWTPGGSKYDGQIIRGGLVVTERRPEADDEEATLPGAVEVPEPQMAPPPVEAARSERRREKVVNGPEPRRGAGGPR